MVRIFHRMNGNDALEFWRGPQGHGVKGASLVVSEKICPRLIRNTITNKHFVSLSTNKNIKLLFHGDL